MPVSTPKAELGGTVIDCLMYGLYLSIFARSVEVLIDRKANDRTSLLLILTTGSLFCLITAHLGLDIDRTFRAFTENMATPNYAKGYFNILSGAEALAKNASYVTITLIADAFLIFRCWAAFGGNWLIVLVPIGLYFGNIGTACWALVTFKEAEDASRGVVIVAQVISRVKFMYICTIALNLWCSLAIALRIWSVQRQSMGSGGHLLRNTITIVVESAAMYSAFLIILITSASLQSPMMYAVLNPMPSIIGVVFSSIIVRVGSGRSFTTEKHETRSALQFRHPSRHGEESTYGMGTTEVSTHHGTSILPTTSVHFNHTSGHSGSGSDPESSAPTRHSDAEK